MIDILMPALSPTMEKGALAKWLVGVGDRVKPGDVIAEVETDKASMEVEAVDAGVVAALLVPAGTADVSVNAPIARLSAEGDASPGADPPAPGPVLSPAVRRIVAEEGLDISRLVGSGRDGRLTKGDVLAVTEAPAAAQRDEALDVSPLARTLARATGLELGALRGSGAGGRIVKADLDVVLGRANPPVAPAGPPGSPRPATDLAPGTYTLVPLDSMRRTIARRTTESFRDVPHFPLGVDLELDALLALRARLNAAAPDDLKVSVNDILIRAAALALKQVPEANASYTPDGIARRHHADIAVAVAIEGGLITPVVRAADTKGLTTIAAEMKDLAQRARARRLKPEEYEGGGFSISNLGMYGVRRFSSILNAPQGAILSVGAGERRPVARDGQLAIATVSSMTLTCDHRAMDGVTGARFLASFRRLIEEPLLLLR